MLVFRAFVFLKGEKGMKKNPVFNRVFLTVLFFLQEIRIYKRCQGENYALGHSF